jgi:predicted ester cyclase
MPDDVELGLARAHWSRHSDQCPALERLGNSQLVGIVAVPGRPHYLAMTADHLRRNKQLVNDFIQELFSKGDLGAVDRYLHPDFINHDPPFPGAPDGPDGMRLAAATFRQSLPDWHSNVEALIAEGDIVVELFTAGGTHRAELMGVAPTGKTVTLRGINIFRVGGNKIVERWGCLDQLSLLRQLDLAR